MTKMGYVKVYELKTNLIYYGLEVHKTNISSYLISLRKHNYNQNNKN